MLTLNDITYRLGERLLLDKASAFLPTGSRVGLVGRNGTGKSTLFKHHRAAISPPRAAASPCRAELAHRQHCPGSARRRRKA
jgi:ATPase subunit of ABC transporter with duplicated ATPase domains